MDVNTSTEAESHQLISRGEQPLNLEMPFASLGDWITPNESFYVRCHFPIPELDAPSWRLRVEGTVATPLDFTYEELREMPSRTTVATVECAGNGRSFLDPKVKGVPWDMGAVGNAEWTGVLLRDVLHRAGANEGEVILEGADKGEIKETPRPSGEIHYARSLPWQKAQDDVLLAWAMNGQPLSPEHGFPLRAVTPGWFGMASVKWLQRIVVSETPFHGYYESIDYTYWERRDGLPTLLPLREMQMKAQIARPEAHEVVSAGTRYRVHGAAWGGDGTIAKVEISVGGGITWAAATLLGEATNHAWRFWEFFWDTPAAAGNCTLIARAVDSRGGTQPPKRIIDYGTYMVNHWLPITVEVR